MGLITGDYKVTYMLENDLMSDPAVGFKTFLHSSAIDNTNMVRYNNPELDRLLDLATSTKDPAEKQQALGEALKIVNEDLPAYSIYTTDLAQAVTKGLTFNVNDITPGDHAYYYRWFWAK